MNYKISIVLLAALFMCSCAGRVEKPVPPVPGKPPAVAKVPVKPPPVVETPKVPAKPAPAAAALVKVDPANLPAIFDGQERMVLEAAILKSISYYERSAGKNFRFGKDLYSAQEMKQSLLDFLEILNDSDPPDSKERRVREKFSAYKSIGGPGKGSVLFTGYFEPVLKGSYSRTEEFRWPVYRTPDDLVFIDLGRFRDKYRGERIVGRVEKRELVPYYSRREIDQNGSLAGRNLELAWLADPVDAFNLHIQGSGTICFPDSQCVQVSYADANGRAYRSIGKYLQEKGMISEQEMSYQSINKYLREHPDEMAEILSRNESYVFFRTVPQGPVGGIQVPLTAGRSIATDPEYFPRGALALIKTRRPVFKANGELQSWTEFSRVVLNQDAGGAIKGPGRVDIFFGTGGQAELEAGSMKEEGELYFLVLRKD